MKNLKISFFGRFTISLDQKSLYEDKERSRKQWRLIKYLILVGDRWVEKRELIDVVFGYGAYSGRPAEALNSLNAMVHRARQTLLSLGPGGDGLIVYQNGAYGFARPEGSEVDCEIFDSVSEMLFSSSDLSLIKKSGLQALDIYGGFFLDGEFFDEKSRLDAEKYHTAYKRIFLLVCSLLTKEGDFRKIAEISERACAIDPLCENFYTERVKACLADGRYTEAEKIYSEAEEFFSSKTSMIPTERFRELGREFSKKEEAYLLLPEKYSDRSSEIKSTLERILGDTDVKISLI